MSGSSLQSIREEMQSMPELQNFRLLCEDEQHRGKLKEVLEETGCIQLLEEIEKGEMPEWRLYGRMQHLMKDVVHYLSEMPREERSVLLSFFVQMLFDPGFIALSQKAMEWLCVQKEEEVQARPEAQLFRSWVAEVMRRHPEHRGEIYVAISKLGSRWIEQGLRTWIAWRPIDELTDEDDEELIVQALVHPYAFLAESRYKEYIYLIDEVLVACGHLKLKKNISFGTSSNRVCSALSEHFPDYIDLIDADVVKIRNAHYHNSVRFDFESELIVMEDRRPDGSLGWDLELSFEELADRLIALNRMVGPQEGVEQAMNSITFKLFQDHLPRILKDAERKINAHRDAVFAALEAGTLEDFLLQSRE